jgi:hypothetical protein
MTALIPAQQLTALQALVALYPKELKAFAAKARPTKADAVAFAGLSPNEKMPCLTLALPALDTCPRGAVLAGIAGTVCAGCYALKGRDAMPPARAAKARRLAVVRAALADQSIRALFIKAFVRAMKGETHFRWHGAGDIFSHDYAQLMVDCIKATPQIKHWIPTREGRYAPLFTPLRNVAFRVSDDLVDQTNNKHKGLTSGVHTGANPSRGRACVAPLQGGECRDCRTCWNRRVRHVSYHLH